VGVNLLQLFAFGLALRRQLLALLLGHRFPRHALAGDHLDDRLKIDLIDLERGFNPQGLTEIGEEVAREDRVLGILGAQFFDPGEGHLFLPGRQFVTFIAEMDDQPLIERGVGHDDTFMNELLQQFSFPCYWTSANGAGGYGEAAPFGI